MPLTSDNYVVNVNAGDQTIELGLWDTAGAYNCSMCRSYSVFISL